MIKQSAVVRYGKCALVLVFAFAGAAQVSPASTLQQFDLSQLRGVCGATGARTQNNENPDQYTYEFERKIYAAARVNFSTDSGGSAREKLKALWNMHQREFSCQANNFNRSNGNLLKYAIASNSFELLDDVLDVWRLDPNMLDRNNETVLDYIETNFSQYHDTEIGRSLVHYHEKLIKHGALHARDVPESQRLAQRVAYLGDLRWHAAAGEAAAADELKHFAAEGRK